MDLGTRLRRYIFGPLETNGAGVKQTGATSGVSFVGPDSARIVLLNQSAADPDADELTRALAFATSAYCYRAVDYRALTLAEPPLGVYQETEDGFDALDGHPLEFLLDEPSPDYDMGELVALTEAYRLITGAALWVKQRPEGSSQVVRLVPFSGDEFTTETADGRMYGRFLISTASGRVILPAEDVVFFRELNPTSWREPVSKVDVALSALDLGHQVNRTVRRFMRNAIFPGGVLSPDKEWNPTPDEWEAWKNAVTTHHAGSGNAGRPLMLLGGTVFSSTALSLKDLLPAEVLDRIEATVAAVFGIPPVVLGWLVGLKNSPWSQMAEARRMTYEDTIEPRWRDMEKRLTRQLLPIEERAAYRQIRFDTSDVRALQDDDKARADTIAVLRDEWTVDERRAYTGKEPLGDERGDEIGGGGGGGGVGLFGAELSEEGPPALKIASDPKGLAWLRFDVGTKAAERTWEGAVYKELNRQRAEVLKLAEQHLTGGEGLDPNQADLFLSKVDQYLENVGKPGLLKTTHPLIFSTGEGAVRQVAAQVGLSFSVLEESLAGYAEREAVFLSGVMGDTTGRAVADAVQKGLDLGETVNEMSERLEGLPAFDRARARLTARTETTRAWNGSQRTTLSDYQKATGHQVFKTWLSSQDDRVRPEHEELNGTQLPIDGVFSNGLTEPGEPNCRCTLIYALADAVGG